jgi:hypothetical protein
MVCAKLGLAHAMLYSDGQKQTSIPDAYDADGKRVELKTEKSQGQFKQQKRTGVSPIRKHGGIEVSLNYNSAKDENKIAEYKTWRHFHILHDIGQIQTIAEVPGEMVMNQLMEVLRIKNEKRKQGDLSVRENFNYVKTFCKTEDLVFINPKLET